MVEGFSFERKIEMEEKFLNKKEFARWYQTTLLSLTVPMKEARKNYVNYMKSQGWYEQNNVPAGNHYNPNQTHTVWMKKEDNLNTFETINTAYHNYSLYGYIMPSHSHNISLNDLQSCAVTASSCPAPVPCNPTPIQGKASKRKAAMRLYDEMNDRYVNVDANPENEKRDYLRERASNTFYSISSDLEKKFGLRDDDRPATASDYIKRILDGMYVLDEKNKDKRDYDPSRYITWRNPAIKKDQTGFDAANDLLSKEKTKVEDTIAILDTKDALAAVQAFENWKPEGLPN